MSASALPPVVAVGLLLRGRTVVVVGAGSVGTAKIEKFLSAGAQVRVIAPRAESLVHTWADEGWVTWHRRAFTEADLDGAFLAVTATGLPDVDGAVFEACEARHLLCNAADDPAACSVHLLSQDQLGPVTLAVGTSGTAPGLTARLRAEARSGLPEDVESLVETYGAIRRWLADVHAPGAAHVQRRGDVLRWLARQPWATLRLSEAELRERVADALTALDARPA